MSDLLKKLDEGYREVVQPLGGTFVVHVTRGGDGYVWRVSSGWYPDMEHIGGTFADANQFREIVDAELMRRDEWKLGEWFDLEAQIAKDMRQADESEDAE